MSFQKCEELKTTSRNYRKACIKEFRIKLVIANIDIEAHQLYSCYCTVVVQTPFMPYMLYLYTCKVLYLFPVS